jgi:hypothetical protein
VWRDKYPEKNRAKTAKQRAMKFMQRCVCCTDAQRELLYLAAKPWGAHAEVDHRIPLALGGKHCAKNLVLLPAMAHREKTKADVRAIAEAKRRSKLLRLWNGLKALIGKGKLTLCRQRPSAQTACRVRGAR